MDVRTKSANGATDFLPIWGDQHPKRNWFPTRSSATDAPPRAEAEAAVALLIRWAGDDPSRSGLEETPARVARAFEEWFGGYRHNPVDFLKTTFDEIGGYSEPVVLRDIPFNSHCEHHMAPIKGKAHVAYVPDRKVVGISKLARVVDAFARRLQIQERLTAEIAGAIQEALQPAGVAVVVEAEHGCMTTRGIHACGSSLVTKAMLGVYREDAELRREFLSSVSAR